MELTKYRLELWRYRASGPEMSDVAWLHELQSNYQRVQLLCRVCARLESPRTRDALLGDRYNEYGLYGVCLGRREEVAGREKLFRAI